MTTSVSIHPHENVTVNKISNREVFFLDLPGSSFMIFGEKITWLRDRLNELYPQQDDPRPCEFCPAVSTTTASDELGNDCLVCDEHAEMLANKTAERTVLSKELVKNIPDLHCPDCGADIDENCDGDLANCPRLETGQYSR